MFFFQGQHHRFQEQYADLVAVVVELVIAREGQQGPKPGAQGEEDLGSRSYPHLDTEVKIHLIYIQQCKVKLYKHGHSLLLLL